MKIAVMIVLALVGAAVALVAWSRAGRTAPPGVGETAPDFSAPSQDGSSVSLKDFRGHWLVLYFYPKDGTSGCTIEAHNFQRDLAKYEQANAVVIGVSVDSTGSHQEFCAKQGLEFKLIADTDKKISREYGSLMNLVVTKMASRNTFLIDPQGKIAQEWIGVEPGRHSSDVLMALAKLAAL
jgi:thioredoxin-dependent peroxiredoxin